MALVYAMYALTFYANLFCPRILPFMSVENTSKKFTMAFSNTPGPIKPFLYSDSAGNKLRTLQSRTFVNVAGVLGFNLAAFSYCKSFQITITADESIFKDVRKLCDMIENNINQEIERHGITLESIEAAAKDTKKDK